MPEPASYPGSPSLSAEAREKVLQTFRHTLDMARAGRNEDALLGCDFILKMDARFAPARRLLSSLRGVAAGTVVDLADFDVFGSVPPAARPAPALRLLLLPPGRPRRPQAGRSRRYLLLRSLRSVPPARASTTSGSKTWAPTRSRPRPLQPRFSRTRRPHCPPPPSFPTQPAPTASARSLPSSRSRRPRPPQATRSPRPLPRPTPSRPLLPRVTHSPCRNPRPTSSDPLPFPPTRSRRPRPSSHSPTEGPLQDQPHPQTPASPSSSGRGTTPRPGATCRRPSTSGAGSS